MHGQQNLEKWCRVEYPLGLQILHDAVERQLGLKLVAAKANFDVIVVDHANRVPTEN